MELAGPSHISVLPSDLDFAANWGVSAYPKENQSACLAVKLEPADEDLDAADPLLHIKTDPLQDQVMTPSKLWTEAGRALACEGPTRWVTAVCISRAERMAAEKVQQLQGTHAAQICCGVPRVKIEPIIKEEVGDHFNIDPAGEIEDGREVHPKTEFDVDPEKEFEDSGSDFDSEEDIEEVEYSFEKERKNFKQMKRQKTKNDRRDNALELLSTEADDILALPDAVVGEEDLGPLQEVQDATQTAQEMSPEYCTGEDENHLQVILDDPL